jgi:hypothetical protein
VVDCKCVTSSGSIFLLFFLWLLLFGPLYLLAYQQKKHPHYTFWLCEVLPVFARLASTSILFFFFFFTFFTFFFLNYHQPAFLSLSLPIRFTFTAQGISSV